MVYFIEPSTSGVGYTIYRLEVTERGQSKIRVDHVNTVDEVEAYIRYAEEIGVEAVIKMDTPSAPNLLGSVA